MELTLDQALQKGIEAHRAGQVQEAERLYTAILKVQPNHPDANHNLGLIAVSFNKAELALPLFKTALEANSKIEQFWLSYIDALIKANHLETVKSVLIDCRKMGFPGEKVDVLETQIQQITQPVLPKLSEKKKSLTLKEKRKSMTGKKLQNQQAKGKSASGISPSQLQLNNLMGHYQNGQYAEAEKLALSMTQQFPEHQFGWKVLGIVFGQTGRKSEAVNANQKAVALSPKDAEAHHNLGITLKEMDRLEEAEASYKRAIGLKPNFATVHNNLGITLKELGRLDEAEASYTQAIVLKSDYAEAYRNLAITLQNLNRWDEAEVSYSQAIFLKPDYDDALIKRGQLLLKRNEFERALRDFEFCNNHRDSILYALIALYALGRIDEMYVKFNTHFEMDDVNIGLEAFSSFIYEKEKRDTGHYFCRNPMDFLYFSNLATHIEDPTSFTEGLIEDLRKKPVNWNPSSTSTNNGFQGRHNLFHNPRGKIRNLQSIIMHELVLYYQKFKNESCSYIQKWPSQKHLVGWHIILKQHGYQTPHIHTGGWLSGVIYLKLVPPLGKDEGAIEFSLNGENYTDSNSPKLVYQPELGDIVFFPSSLHHRTIPFTTDTDRIIVSFDLMPKEAKH